MTLTDSIYQNSENDSSRAETATFMLACLTFLIWLLSMYAAATTATMPITSPIRVES